MARVKGFTFEWHIENFSFIREKLRSSPFIAFSIDKDAKWQLELSLKLSPALGRDICIIGLHRVVNHKGIEIIHLEYQLTVVSLDESFRGKNFKCSFPRDGSRNKENKMALLDVNKYLKMRKASYLPSDTLTVRCWMARDETIPVQRLPRSDVGPEYCFARTWFKVQRAAFSVCMDNFSEFSEDEIVEMRIKSASRNYRPLSIELTLSDQGMIMMRLVFERNVLGKWYTFRWYLLHVLGMRTFLGCRESNTSLREIEFPMNVSKRYIMGRRNIHLVNDELSLHCELLMTEPQEFSKVEKMEWNLPPLHKKWPFPSDIKNKLLHALQEDEFTDVEIKRKNMMIADGYTMKAHSVIMSLQSPKCGLFLKCDSRSRDEIPTVIQTTIAHISLLRWAIYLLYMDGDVDGLSLENTIELFRNQDIVRPLAKAKLKNHFEILLDLNNYCSALKLSFESHAGDLVKIAQEFVLRNEQVVFGTDQWRRLEQECPELASDTLAMYAERKLFASSKTRLPRYSPSF
ncbi:speckle-type POZ protein [Caerostris darwini]|uniref:Speckle-type POZ protein n=1 Tax=Caerostris darwini TaxID=1538125 RepID=A0AAV4S6Q7_9ARAC|nr:speckle-type POZ protein [Caerostris darwini]